jgi:cytochrome c
MSKDFDGVARRRARDRYCAKIFAAAACATLLCSGGAYAEGDADRGAQLYRGCEDCHSIEKNEVGPKHQGVVGRTAGSVPDFNYSPALKNSNVVWTEDNLDKWLTNPQAFVPGARMFYKVNKAQDRADLIAFLKERAQ